MIVTQDQIIKGLLTSDQNTLGHLYDQYGAALFGVVLRIVGDRELAENVLQDTFLKIWKSGATYNPEKAGIFVWMSRIARNTAIDSTRSAYFKQRSETADADQLVYMEEADPFNPEYIGLREILGKLEDKYRVIIEKAYFEGYTQQDIEKELGIPLGTVKSRMRQAMIILRQHLSEYALMYIAFALIFLNNA